MNRLTDQLKEKIKTKMDVATFFSGFIALSLGLTGEELSGCVTSADQSIFIPTLIGIVFILAALAYSIATMFAYDRLLMPHEFWTKRPEDFNTTLYEEMKKAWMRLFVPAVISFFLSLICFIIALFEIGWTSVGLICVPVLVWLRYKFYSNIGKQIHG